MRKDDPDDTSEKGWFRWLRMHEEAIPVSNIPKTTEERYRNGYTYLDYETLN